MPRIRLNGEDREVPSTNLAELVTWLALPTARVAVERNGEVVPRARWTEAPLADDDHIEVVTFVGGG